MTKDTPTPRTDAELAYHATARSDGNSMASGMTMFARTLERDLSECRAALRELVAVEDYVGEYDGCDTYRQNAAWSTARAILAKGEGK